MAMVLEKDVMLQCVVDSIVHPNKAEESTRAAKNEELWTIFKTYIKNGTHYELRTCAGMAPHLDVGDSLTLTGDLVDSGPYGVQFKFTGLQKMIPTEQSSLIVFFTRNLSGVGQKSAEKIVCTLGPTAVEQIEADYKVLVEKVGLTEKKALSIAEQLGYLHSSVDELKFFAKTGLGPARIAAIKQFYATVNQGKKFDLIGFITENPYQLIDDVKNIGFKLADSIALNLGFAPNDPKRIAAGIKYTLKDEVDAKGNIWTDKAELIETAAGKDFLNIQMLEVEPIVQQLVESAELIEENNRIYLPYYFQLEHDLAEKIHNMQAFENRIYTPAEIEAGIEEAQKAKGRSLDEGQANAVRACVNSNVSIITGGPGTGKTTTLDTLLYFLEKKCNMEVTMCAPTGRAAKRMTEQTKRDASTIHSLSLKKTSADFKAFRSKRHVIVADESSMIDVTVLKMLMDLCDVSTKIVFVGDVDQLPSIGAGQILRDMIESEAITTARLSTIHRQSGDSNIITNAHAIINGKHLEETFAKDFFVSQQESEEKCLEMLKKLVCVHYPNKLSIDPSEIQILAPLKKGALGVSNLNKVMQEALNPPAIGKRELNMSKIEFGLVFREGDRVIQMKNDYSIMCEDGSEGVFNGEIGKIEAIETLYGETSVFVDFGDRVAVYDSKSIRNLSLAYAITIHKSQGSEFRVVIIPLFTYMMPMIYNRNLLYTAVTRAKQYCCIIGQMATINKMIHNNTINRRRTTFTIRLNGKSDDTLIVTKKRKRTTSTKKASTKKTMAKKETAKKATKKAPTEKKTTTRKKKVAEE